ncbi:DUF4166 domain-containing protein [Nocardia sp. 348MFTsu5.1]|uniref:DUF4166 domain-containing protein n=1 Tax=Nocardia sp. 348MFTsu5.1 TaxID=1172185 RepID=UPI00035F7BB0|nr:DUF4166 domain-containing protein [Nocardia sp. 348MFTsu5.1]
MSSVIQNVLGPEFEKLHPNLQWRYGIDSQSQLAQETSGIMESIYSSPVVSTALRHFGKRNAMPTKSSRLVPFTMHNYCYQDELGRESLAVMRSLNYTSGPQGLNSLLVDGREGLVDYFGDGPELLWPLEASVDRGSLIFQSGPMRLLTAGPKVGMRGLLAARMLYAEGWDSERNRFRVDASVRNPVIGELIHYRGWFTAQDVPCRLRDIPDEAWPHRLIERES